MSAVTRSVAARLHSQSAPVPLPIPGESDNSPAPALPRMENDLVGDHEGIQGEHKQQEPLLGLHPNQAGDVPPLPPLCDMSREELTAFGPAALDVNGGCRYCHHIPPEHPRRLVPLVDPPLLPAPVPVPPRRYTEFSKVVVQLQKHMWSTKSVCRTVLKELKYILQSNDVDPAKWTCAMLAIMDTTPSKDWIQLNIITPNLDWDDACVIFTIHFQSADTNQVLRKEFDAIHQQKGESVQTYADRFNEYVAQLNEPDNPSTIHKFITNLLPSLHRAYLERVDLCKTLNPLFLMSSLDQAMKMCIMIDVGKRTVYDSTGHEGTGAHVDQDRNKRHQPEHKAPYAWPPRQQRKVCKNCPHLSNHTTAECRRAGAAGSKGGPVYVPGPARPTMIPPVKKEERIFRCYTCGEMGHKSPDCPKKKDNSQGASSSAPKSDAVGPGGSFRAVSIADLDRTLPLSILAPTVHQTPILFYWRGRVCPTLLDSGTTHSVMDLAFAKEMGLKIEEQKGHLTLANGSKLDRVGKTEPLQFDAHFPDTAFKPRALTFAFELMNLGTHEYQFMIGTDMVEELFPDGNTPTRFFTKANPDKPTSSHCTVSGHGSGVQDDGTCTRMIDLVEPINLRKISISTTESDDAVRVPISLLDPIAGMEHDLKCWEADLTWPKDASGGFIDIKSVTTVDADHDMSRLGLSDIVKLDSSPDAEELTMPVKVEISTSEEQKQEYEVQRYKLANDPDVIAALAENEKITGFCNLPGAVFHINVDPAKKSSLYRKQYRIEQRLVDKANEVVDKWKASGKVVRAPPNCPYNNPITVAPKKDEKGDWTLIRVCLDLRAVNEALLDGDKFQLPYIPHAMERFAGCRIFGELDLSDAYLQIMLDKESQPLTAFTWGGEQWMFVGCPFGEKDLVSFFQRLMSTTTYDLPFTFPYLDNLPFGSRTWEEHREHLLILVDRMTKANLRIKPASVKFGHSEMRCLGHVLSIKGIGIDPKKKEAIMKWEPPKTGKELQSFLGFVTFVRDHVRYVAELTAPLEAIKNEKVLVWTDKLCEHFELTKKAVYTAPFLQLPDYSRPFYIATDASNTGIGGVLYQPRPEDDENITATNMVAIHSKKLRSEQCNYSAYKKELYGIVQCMLVFHPYIWGRDDLVIITDHKPLTYMLHSHELSEALRRWLDIILSYNFKIKHRAGVLNVIPDALSRMFGTMYADGSVWGVSNNAQVELVLQKMGIGDSSLNAPPLNLSKTVQVKSIQIRGFNDASDLQHLSSILMGEGKPCNQQALEEPEVKIRAKDVEDVSDQDIDLEEYEEAKQVLDDIDPNQAKLLVEMELRGKKVPAVAEREELIEDEHLMGHFGRDALYKKLYHKGYWWPGMRRDVEDVLANCDACTRYTVVKSGFHPASFITANGPLEHIQIDTSVHLPESREGYKVLLVIIDVFTGFVWLKALKSNNAENVAVALWELFCTFGLPKILQSDNGSEFINEIIRSLVRIAGIDHRLIAPYNPRTDGKVERSIGTITSIIKKMLHGNLEDWPLYVPFAQLAFNTKIASLTNSSPFSLMFGRTINEMKNYSKEPPGDIISQQDWTAYQEKILTIIYPAVSEAVLKKKQSMVERLDQQRRTLKGEAFPAGSIVMLKDPTPNRPKFEPKYLGPYTVLRRTRGGTYQLRDATGDNLDRTVPADQLKFVAKKPRRTDIDSLGHNVYEVETILNHRGQPGCYDYEVKWKGYPDPSWEPATSFLDDSIIRTYWKQQKTKTKGHKTYTQ
jgi:hypothetical protein